MASTVFNIDLISRTLWFQLDHEMRSRIYDYVFGNADGAKWNLENLETVAGKRNRWPIRTFFAGPGVFLLSRAVLRLMETVKAKTEKEREMALHAALLFDQGGDEELEPQDDDNEIVQLQNPRARRA